MAEYTEDQLFNMSDEELERAFSEAKEAELNDSEDDNDSEELDPQVDEESSEDIDDDEDLEQPDDEDSDSNDEDAEDEVDDESDEDSEEDEDELDGESEDSEEQPEEDAEETKEEAKKVEQEYKLKANGKEYTFTEKEIMEQFPSMFAKAKDYTQKMQAIKPWRKTIDALETAELSHEDVSLMIDVLKGNKDAVAEVLKRTGVDALELDAEERSYVANDYGRDAKALDLKDVVNSIKDEPEYATTHKILSKEWDDASWDVMSNRPDLIKALHVDVKSGLFAALQPIAEKLKLFGDGSKSDLEYYGEAAKEYAKRQEGIRQQEVQAEQARAEEVRLEAERVEKAKKEKAERQAVKNASKKRKAATPAKKGSSAKKATDYLDAYDDESYHEWAKRVDDSV